MGSPHLTIFFSVLIVSFPVVWLTDFLFHRISKKDRGFLKALVCAALIALILCLWGGKAGIMGGGSTEQGPGGETPIDQPPSSSPTEDPTKSVNTQTTPEVEQSESGVSGESTGEGQGGSGSNPLPEKPVDITVLQLGDKKFIVNGQEMSGTQMQEYLKTLKNKGKLKSLEFEGDKTSGTYELLNQNYRDFFKGNDRKGSN